jgi:hypothetical protein
MSESQPTEPANTATFDYTQGAYWGGPWYPYWSLLLISVLGGYIGLDHLYLRSPTTALAKLLVNLFAFGLWYVYDLLQLFREKENVMKYGLTAPALGPLGIGAGMFTDNQPANVKISKSPLRYFGYMMLVGLPFGFDFVLAGDLNGALSRFISILLFFLWPISFIWTIMNIITAIFMPKNLFDNGPYRLFPFSWLLEPYGPSVLGPVDLPNPPDGPDGCAPGGSKGMFRSMFDTLVSVITIPVQAVLNIILPGFIPAARAVETAVEAGATAAAAGLGAVTEVAKATGEGAQILSDAAAASAPTITATSSLVQQAKGALTAAGATASTIAKSQRGGGGLDAADPLNLALFSFFIVLLGSGIYIAVKRLNNTFPIFKKKEDEQQQPNRQQRDDTPPKP